MSTLSGGQQAGAMTPPLSSGQAAKAVVTENKVAWIVTVIDEIVAVAIKCHEPIGEFISHNVSEVKNELLGVLQQKAARLFHVQAETLDADLVSGIIAELVPAVIELKEALATIDLNQFPDNPEFQSRSIRISTTTPSTETEKYLRKKQWGRRVGIASNVAGKATSIPLGGWNIPKMAKHGFSEFATGAQFTQLTLMKVEALFKRDPEMDVCVKEIMWYKALKMLLRGAHLIASAPWPIPLAGTLVSIIADFIFMWINRFNDAKMTKLAQRLHVRAYQEVTSGMAGPVLRVLEAILVFEGAVPGIVAAPIVKIVREPKGYVAILNRLSIIS